MQTPFHVPFPFTVDVRTKTGTKSTYIYMYVHVNRYLSYYIVSHWSGNHEDQL